MALGRPELATDARFLHHRDRIEHRSELDEVLTAAFATWTVQHWCRVLEDHGVPVSPHPASRRDLQRSAHRRDRHGRHRRPCVGSARTDRLPGQFRWGTTAAAVGATAARGTHRRDPCGISGGLRSVLATNVSNVADLRPFPIDRRRPQRCSDPNRSGDILVRGLSRSLSAAALLRSTRPDFSAIRGGNVRETRAAHDRHRLHDRRLARKNDTCS